jgi:hypothetical protein
MLKMLAMYYDTSFSLMLHGLMDVLKNARSMRTEVQPF